MYSWICTVFALACCLAVLSACGRPQQVDPFLQPYLTEFQSQAQVRRVYVDVSQIDANFSDELPHWIVARCKDGKIEFNITYWYAYSDSDREAVMFHELGHCALHRNHGLGIMRERHISGKSYMEKKAQLLDELFLR